MTARAMLGAVSWRRCRGSGVHHLGMPVILLVVLLGSALLVREKGLVQRVISLPGQSSPDRGLSSRSAKLGASSAADGNQRQSLRRLGFRGGSSRKPTVEPSDESRSISPIDVPFLQDPDKFRLPGNGISLESLGEPKSGTTWLGRLVPSLALELCGNEDNQWCELGGLVVRPNNPAPSYEFELLTKANPSPGGQEAAGGTVPTLFLHFKGEKKHIIPGMDTNVLFGEDTRMEPGECHNGGYPHKNGFEDHPPCLSLEPPTRERLQACLWETSIPCLRYTASADPAVRRSIVIFRDPRDVVLSAYKMRTEKLHHAWVLELSLEEYIRTEFEVLVSWLHQRWMWHTSTAFAPSSHVVYYEESQVSHEGLVGIASLMGLKCSQEIAFKVWEAHRSASPHGNFATHEGLSEETIEWMTAIMARLLPPPLARKWQVTPVE